MSKQISRRSILAAGATTAAMAVANAFIWTPASASALTNERSSTLPAAFAKRPAGGTLDTVVFGDAASETAHGLGATLSSVVGGMLGQSARVFNPHSTPGWWGGSAGFTVAVDPSETTYVTVKLWGGDFADMADQSHNWRLQLFVEGKSVGWYDEGPVDNLDQLGTDPRSPGRFFFHTLPLPERMTKGKKSLQLEIRSMGRIFDYGGTVSSYFYDQTEPSRPVYRVYTHTDPYFTPDASDVLGAAPASALRPNGDESALANLTAAVLNEHDQLLYGGGAYGSDAWGFNMLAEGYTWKASPAYQNPDALTAICAAIDSRYRAWKVDPAVLTASDQQWQGFGRVGLTLAYLWEDIQGELDKNVTNGYASMFNPSFEQGGATPLGWSVQGWANKGSVTRDTTVSHAGGASAKIVADPAGNIVVSPNSKTLVGAGQFEIDGWIKTDGTATTPKLDVLFWDEQGNLVGSDHNFFVQTGTADWQHITGALTIPTGAATFQIWLVVNNGETAWFDDISFRAPSADGLELFNPGFENGGTTPLGWVVLGWASDGTVTRDTAHAHGGAASAKLVSNGGGLVVGPAARTKVAAGQFTVTGWAKTNGAATSPKLDVLFWDAKGNLAGADHNVFVATGTTDWQKLASTFNVPDGAVEFEIWMVVGSGETAWFDDLSFTAPAPSSAAIGRRAAYTDMLLSSRDYWKQNMRHYSNQAQITAIGIYQANRGLSLISPADAWPESRARLWIYESLGMTAWYGSELPDGTRTKPLGTDYYVVTPNGLTRELGYVGSYGEVTDWLVMMYESITRGHGAVTAPEVRERMVEMIQARGYFRQFNVDADGYRICRLETVVGWRNEQYPGIPIYASRTVWDCSPVMAAAAFDDSKITGWTQEMMADGQFAPQLTLMFTNTSNRVQLNATRMLARDLPMFRALPASDERMPVNWDAPDFTFTDEVDGVIAVKNGRELFFASLYWRARQGINEWGRVHLLSPSSEQSATVREKTGGTPSSNTFTVQDWVNQDYTVNDSNGGSDFPEGGLTPPGDTVHQAYEGEVLPLAIIPADAHPALGSTELGVEEALVGIAPYYQLRYGRYLVAMNTTKDQTFTLKEPGGGTARMLTKPPTGFHGNPDHVALAKGIAVPARTTVILHLA